MATTITAYLKTAGMWMMLALVTSATLLAQRYTFRQYGSVEGLSNLAVNCLLQDRVGYIWVGTDDGLFRYDGSRFQYFGHAEGLPNTEIRGLAESADGVLWVATESGVARSSGFAFETVEVGGAGLFRSVAIDALGRVYLWRTSGISRGERNGVGAYEFRTIAKGQVGSMFVQSEDVWFGRGGDVWRFARNREERVGSTAGLPAGEWNAITKDVRGNLWMRSTTQLYEIRAGETRVVDRSAAVPHTSDSRLYADREGLLYVSTSQGLMVLDGATVTSLDAQHGLPGDVVCAVLVDRDGSLWLGVVGGGVVRRLGHGEWVSWKKEDGLLHNEIWSIRRDSSGRTWVGSGGGLNVLDARGKMTRSWTSRSGLAADRVLAVVEGPGGAIFVATDPSGISRFDKRGDLVRTYAKAPGTPGRANAMAVDRQGRLWAVGDLGCYRTKPLAGSGAALEFERVEVPEMTPQTEFRDVVVDPGGAVWLASSTGLVRFDGSGWRVFRERDGLKRADTAAIVQGNGTMWIAYRDALGVSKIEFDDARMRITHVTKKDGLSSDLIYDLTYDSTGRLWLMTAHGVDVLERGVWRNYDTEDGLIWNDGNGLALTADAGNALWVGTSGGLSRYTPPVHPVAEGRPSILLESIEAGSKRWNARDQPELPYSKRTLSIRYASLSYIFENRVRFRYRLQGYEDSWNETTERSAYFAALPAGHYVFEVVAAGPNGLWGEVPARFAFSIKTPWWQSWWFLTLCGLMTVLLGRMLWSLRVRVLVSQKEQLERQITERTNELSKSHRKLEELAYCDMLTSLPNRRRFTEEFRTRSTLGRRPVERFALLLVDLDHFKQINDTYGHDAGDAVLVEVAVRLRVSVREFDCVARLGGDEFAILLITTENASYVDDVCRRIVDSLSEGIRYRDTLLTIGCSIGVAWFPEDGDSEETLYKAADLAMYEAKRTSGEAFCWHRPEIDPDLRHGSAAEVDAVDVEVGQAG